MSGKKKHTRTLGQKTLARKRLMQNQIKKYKDLLKRFPNSPHTKKWAEKLAICQKG